VYTARDEDEARFDAIVLRSRSRPKNRRGDTLAVMRRSRWTACLLAFLLVACSPGELSLFVDVKTDFVPNEEFTLVRTDLFEDTPDATSIPIASDIVETLGQPAASFVTGLRVGELSELSPGTRVVRVQLLSRDGLVVIERLARVPLNQSRVVTLLLTRDCYGVTCPRAGDSAELDQCLGGRCVDPACTVEDLDTCPMPECVMDSDCPEPTVECGTRRCESGICLALGDDALCPPTQYCNPERGCEPRDVSDPDAGTGDAGTADAGTGDAGGVDGGPVCVPRTCTELSAECGAPPDECGSTLDCGTCTTPEVCGGGSTPYVCATPPPVDTTAPSVTISTGPPDPTSSTSASLTFTGSDTGGSGLARFECRLDTGAWTTCTSPRSYTSLAAGSHTFRLRAFDGAGNMSTVATWTWTIDTTLPTCNVTTSTACSSDPTPRIDFTCSDAGGIASRECQLDSGPWGACTTATTFLPGSLADGSHTVRVRAADTAGNVSTPAVHTWTVDATLPTLTITSAPANPIASSSASFSFTSSDSGCAPLTRTCRLDSGAWGSCSSPKAYSGVSDGSHTFGVRATDAAGNVRERMHTWVIDTSPPIIDILPITDPAPTNYTATPTVAFTYTCNDGSGTGCISGTRTCRVDGVAFTCSWLSGSVQVGYTGAHIFGAHSLVVTVADALGNVGTSPGGDGDFTVTRCATDLQYPNRTSTGFTRGACCSGLVNTSGWTDFSFGFFHPRGDGSCRPMSDWNAQPYECIWGGASCPSGYQTTQSWGGGCTSGAGRTTCVPSLAAAQLLCGTDGDSGSQTPFHGRASEGWHPAPTAGCSTGLMSSSQLMRRTCSEDVCWSAIDQAGARFSISSSELCKSGLTRRCRTNPFDSSVACVCLPTASPAPYASDGRG
jgi:hypothetical protein